VLKYGYTVFDEDMNMKELNLTATDSRSVILIEEGLLHRLPELVRNLFPLSKVLIVTDENVEKLYGKSVYESLARSGIPCVKKVLPFGERTKSFEYLNIILDCLGENGFTRSDAVMALGGGVIGDVTEVKKRRLDPLLRIFQLEHGPSEKGAGVGRRHRRLRRQPTHVELCSNQ
jgi:hypothetical protein